MKTYQVTLTGRTPLLMHHDNIEWADYMGEWQKDPGNKGVSKAGDDRTPPWRWLGCVYHDGTQLAIPQGNIMRAIMEGGASVMTGGKNGKTFKAQTQSGMMCVEPAWPMEIAGKRVRWADVERATAMPSFAENKEHARAMGFDLLVKRAKVGSSKHVRVRPQFDAGWQVSGTLAVWDDMLTEGVLARILEYAGQYKGLGDWRPGGKTPGPYGTFDAVICS